MEAKKTWPFKIVFGRRQGRFPFVNSLVIELDGLVVIDPHSDKNVMLELSSKYPGANIFHSHFHSDHIKYTEFFKEAIIHVHQHDAPVYTSVEALDRFTGISTILGPDALKNEEHLFRMKIAPDRTFQDGDEFNFNGITFRMVHTPGHSPGHSCFYFPDERFLYLADIDLTDFGPWYGNPSANLDDFIASIEKVKSIDADYYLSAHEAGLMDREDFLVKMEKFSSHISRRDELILEFLSEPRTLQDILSRRIIYPKVMKNKTDVWITYAERRMIEQHIVRLKRAGAIREENGKFLRT